MVTDDISRRVLAALRRREGPTSELGITLDDCGPGWATASLTLTPVMLNGLGSAHGGVLFTLGDTAFAWACNSGNVATVAQSASIAFLSPGKAGERITASARETAQVGRSGVYDVPITGEDGRIVAVFQGLSRSLGRPVIDVTTGELVNA